MSKPRSASPGGINRAALNRASTPVAAEATAAVVPRTTPLPHGQRAQPAPGPMQELWQSLLLFCGVLGGLIALLVAVYLVRDSMAVGAHLAEAKNERTTLICQNGRMSHGDGSLHDLVFAKSYFVCTDWRTLQAIELQEKPR